MPKPHHGPDENLILNLSANAPVAESYRGLRTNLRFLDVEKPLRSLLITSPGSGEGKTLTASNLAIVTAEAGARVILIDGDLRKSQVHRLFRFDSRVGLTTVLVGRSGLPAALQPTPVRNLRVLPAGPKPPNPAELLGSRRMADVLAELKRQADMVIIDSPPVLVVTDAAVLAAAVDGVVMVVNPRLTTYQAAQKSKAVLEQVKAHLLGVVLNEINPNGLSGYYYSYYYGSYRDEESLTAARQKGRHRRRGS